MQSLFDPIEDIKLPEPKKPTDWKKVAKVSGLVVLVVGLGVGGYFTYYAIYPPKLTERPLPPTMDRLLVELKDARDGIDSQTRDIYGRIEQFNKRMKILGRKQLSFSQVFLQGLSAEEEQALDDLVRQEKDPSYRGILGQVVEDMKKIRGLQAQVSDLESKLPGDGREVKPGDTHMRMAREYLVKERGVPETRADELVTRLNIMETGLQKGNLVHFYYDPAKDFFGTWVAQGDAKRSPLAIVRAREMSLIQERDTAVAKASDLEEQKYILEEMRDSLQKEVAALEARKVELETSVASLEVGKEKAEEEAKTTGARLAQQQNSLFYEADLAERLRERGVLRTLNKVENIGDVKFREFLDLRLSKSITLKPSQFGIAQIRDIRIVPAFLKEGRDLGVRFGDDGTVEVTVLNEAALKGQKVLFVLEKGER